MSVYKLTLCLLLHGASVFAASVVAGAELKLQVSTREGAGLQHAVVALVPYRPLSFNSQAEAVMDQRNRQFEPHVLAVRQNTKVHFPNSDDIRHHVYSFSPAKTFELRLYHGTTAEPVIFDKPGRVVLGCNIHDAMLGYIYVLKTPWFGVTGPEGVVELKSIPPGDYRVEVRHPRQTEPLSERVSLTAEQSWSGHWRMGPLKPDPRKQEPKSELERLFD